MSTQNNGSSKPILTSGTKVRRYFPGRAPGAVDLLASESESDSESTHDKEQLTVHETPKEPAVGASAREAKPPTRGVWRSIDERVSESEEDEEQGEDKRQSQTEQVYDIDEYDETQPIGETLKMQGLLKPRLSAESEEEVESSSDEGETTSSEESESSGSDDDDSEMPIMPLLKPVFVPKSKREAQSIANEPLDDMHDQEEGPEVVGYGKKRQVALSKRREESRRMAAEQVKRDIEVSNVEEADPLAVDDTDGVDEEAEYNAWRLRELRRLKRYKEEREAADLEEAERERRRNMTEEERVREDMERVRRQREEKERARTTKVSGGRYYHKGAFYQDIDPTLLNRPMNEMPASLDPRKGVVPDIALKKNFGRSGQTKWTTLAKEDTSSQDSLWFQDRRLTKRVLGKMGGMHRDDELGRPKRRR